jgi:hypothetical protein
VTEDEQRAVPDGAERWLAALRWMLLALALWDAVLGSHALANPTAVGPYPALEKDQLYVRIVGLFWLFMAYVQLAGWRDPLRNLAAVQIAVSLRLPTGLLNLAELLVLYPGPFNVARLGILLFAAGDLAVWGLGAYALRRLGRPWWLW